MEILDGNERTAHDAVDASITSKSNQKGKKWMVKHSLPYGLNDRLGHKFVKEDVHVLEGFKFSALLRKATRISQGHVYKLNTSLSADAINLFK